MTSRPDNDLFRLLDALCDDRLDEAGALELQQRVVNDAETRRLYVDYVILHGLLHWDAVGGTSYSEIPVFTSSEIEAAPIRPATPSSADRRPKRSALAVVACAAAAIIAAVVMMRPHPPAGDPSAIAKNPPVPKHLSKGTPDEDGGGAALNPVKLSHDAPEVAVDQIPIVPPVSPDQPAIPRDIVAFIDDHLTAGWKEAGVEPAALADDAEWLRRVSLDLVGHIPELHTTKAFLADRSPDKRAKMVDHLLEEPEFASHMATVWTNLLVGRAAGRNIDRDALVRFLREQFWKNRPWTETVTDLVSAEGSEHENGAANFLLAHLNNQAVPATAITARIFLCEQVQCTQCHVHPTVKTWGQDQFWELNAFFNQTEIVESKRQSDDGKTHVTRQLVSREKGGPSYFETLGGVMRVAYPKFEGREISPEAGVNRRAELARLMSEGDRPQLALAFVNRLWAQMFGQGFTSPVDDMGPHSVVAYPEVMNGLAEDFVRSNYDVKRLVRTICSVRAYQLSSRVTEANAADAPDRGQVPLFSRMYVKPMTAEQLFDSLIVSTSADRAGIKSWSDAAKKKSAWLSQFYTAMDNEENSEATTFDGSLPQALVMMNGDLVREATSGSPGTFLHEVLASPGSEAEKLKTLSLSALAREPSKQEAAALQKEVRLASRGDQGIPPGQALNQGLADAYWAYLNSAEFLSIH